MSKLRDKAAGIGGCLLYIAVSAIPILLLIALFKSMRWIAEVGLPISQWVAGIGLLLVPICLVLAVPRVTRGWAGLGLTISSYTLGFSIWLWALVLAYVLAGTGWMIVGLCLAGVGVVAVAAIAAGIRGEWFILIQIVVGIAIVYALRIFGAYLVDKSEPKDEYIPSPPRPPASFDDDDEALT